MKEHDLREILVDTAIQIRHIVGEYIYAVHELELARDDLRKNHEICHTNGVVEYEEYMTFETQLEKAINAARYNSFVSELDQLSCEYVKEMETCGFPMALAYPDELKKLLYPPEFLKELKL